MRCSFIRMAVQLTFRLLDGRDQSRSSLRAAIEDLNSNQTEVNNDAAFSKQGRLKKNDDPRFTKRRNLTQVRSNFQGSATESQRERRKWPRSTERNSKNGLQLASDSLIKENSETPTLLT